MNPFISLRLMDHHMDKQLLDDLIDVLKRQPSSTDEVWLCSEYAFPPLEKIAQTSEKMLDAAERFRALGIIPSLQISNTIGHGDYISYMDFSGMTWRRMMGPDGETCKYINCPTCTEFLDYIKESTRLYSRFKPAIIWIDDDLRMHNHGSVRWGCFCDECMKIFNEKYGSRFTRPELWNRLSFDDDPTWRERWVAFNEERLVIVTHAVMEGCLEASPDTIGGLQHGGSNTTLYNGRDRKAIFDEMYKMTGKPPMSRPGGGFYYDGEPRGMLEKALSIDFQNCCLPPYIDKSRPEIENLPHLALGKTAHGTCIESTLYLAYGCNALSYASLMMDNDAPAVHETMLARLSAWKPYWQRLVETNRTAKLGGLKLPRGLEIIRQPNRGQINKFFWDSPNLHNLYEISITGLPIHWENGNNEPYLLYPTMVDGLSDAELISIFKQGVLTCGESIAKLGKRGLSYLAGMESEKIDGALYCERYLDTGFVSHRDVRKNSMLNTISVDPSSNKYYRLIQKCNNFTRIAHYCTYDGEDIGTSAAIAENELGGRIAVFGYSLWTSKINVPRRTALLRIADFVCKGRLAAYITTTCQCVVVPRVECDGKLRSVTIFNACIDTSDLLTIVVRNPASKTPLLIRPCEADMRLEVDESKINIPPIPPWSCASIIW